MGLLLNLLTTNVPIIQKPISKSYLQSICSANQLAGFYMMGTLDVKGLSWINFTSFIELDLKRGKLTRDKFKLDYILIPF